MNEKLLLETAYWHELMGLLVQVLPQHMPDLSEARTGYNTVFILSFG